MIYIMGICVVGVHELSFATFAFAFLEAGVGVAVQGDYGRDVICDVGYCAEGAFEVFSDSGPAGLMVC